MKSLLLNAVALVGAVVLPGCKNCVYSVSSSVDEAEPKIRYQVVSRLPSGDESYPQSSMPIVVSDRAGKVETSSSLGLWLLTLGVIPGFEECSLRHDIEISTPLGKKSAFYTISGKTWSGWLPCFLPYPSAGEERQYGKTAEPETLRKFESSARDKTIKALVAQFSNDAYANFVTKHNSPEAKAQRIAEADAEKKHQVKEERERENRRVLAEEELLRKQRQSRIDAIVASSLSEIRACYAKGKRFVSPYPRPDAKKSEENWQHAWKSNEEKFKHIQFEIDRAFAAVKSEKQRGSPDTNKIARLIGEARQKNEQLKILLEEQKGLAKKNPEDHDWLSDFVAPRLELSEKDRLAGEAMLAEFGNKHMPNAYAALEKTKSIADELQQIFNEEFQCPWRLRNSDSKWESFNKILEKFVKARTAYFVSHDELCHFWMLYRCGVLQSTDLTRFDRKQLAVHLFPENVAGTSPIALKAHLADSKVMVFAQKFAPECADLYLRLERDFRETDRMVMHAWKDHRIVDMVRFDRTFYAAIAKRNELVRELNALSRHLESWNLDHRTGEKKSSDIAKASKEMAEILKPYECSLKTYIADHAMGRVISRCDMIRLPSNLYVQRTEVTQLQWMMVMGTNPSKFQGADLPVTDVSWDDVQAFIHKLNARDGRTYRLPYRSEWEYACAAGSKGDWGLRRTGECGPLSLMGWCSGSIWKTNECAPASCAGKEPNAWGLFDMHGNVWEWCGDKVGSQNRYRVRKGGSLSECKLEFCAVPYWRGGHNDQFVTTWEHDRSGSNVGFRLVSDSE